MNTEILTEEQISREAIKRFYDGQGYDLWAIEAFEIGAKIALRLKEQGKGILNYEYIEDGYKWAVEKLWSEK